MIESIETLVRYEWKAFIRNTFQLFMLLVMAAIGMYAIYSGQSEINQQRKNIEIVSNLEKEEFSKYRSSFENEEKSLEEEQLHDIASRPEFAWYRHGYHAIIPPHDFASLSIGQRDLFRYYYRLTGMSLYYQLFENELANPVNLMIGNFDLSFLIVYLIPLLIIAFCYNLFSSEKENGTLALLQIQSISIPYIIFIRLTFYFFILTGFILLISTVGIISAGSPLTDANFLPTIAWLSIVVAYSGFWFGLCYLINSFRKSSSFNAVAAIGCWLLFLIIIPTVLNVVASSKYPLNSATLAGLTRRSSMGNEDDEKAMKKLISEYLNRRPDLQSDSKGIENNLMAKGYASFTSLGDIKNKAVVDAYNSQVAKRNDWTSRLQWTSPAINMQNCLALIAKTDLTTFLLFQTDLANFHKKITDFYFKRLFRDQPIKQEDYNQLPTFTLTENDNRWKYVWFSTAKIFLAGIFITVLGFFRFLK